MDAVKVPNNASRRELEMQTLNPWSGRWPGGGLVSCVSKTNGVLTATVAEYIKPIGV